MKDLDNENRKKYLDNVVKIMCEWMKWRWQYGNNGYVIK